MPDRAERHFNKGVACAKAGEHAKAVGSLDRGLAIEPDYPLAWYSRGFVHSKLGWYSDLIASFDRARALNPECTEVQKTGNLHSENPIRNSTE